MLRQSILATHDEASLNTYAQQPDVFLKNKAVCHLLVASCRGRAQVLVLYEPQVGNQLNAMLVGILSPVWRQSDS